MHLSTDAVVSNVVDWPYLYSFTQIALPCSIISWLAKSGICTPLVCSAALRFPISFRNLTHHRIPNPGIAASHPVCLQLQEPNSSQNPKSWDRCLTSVCVCVDSDPICVGIRKRSIRTIIMNELFIFF